MGTTRTDFTDRLAALDRAIGRLASDPTATTADVVAMAQSFEQYLTSGLDAYGFAVKAD